MLWTFPWMVLGRDGDWRVAVLGGIWCAVAVFWTVAMVRASRRGETVSRDFLEVIEGLGIGSIVGVARALNPLTGFWWGLGIVMAALLAMFGLAWLVLRPPPPVASSQQPAARQ